MNSAPGFTGFKMTDKRAFLTKNPQRKGSLIFVSETDFFVLVELAVLLGRRRMDFCFQMIMDALRSGKEKG
jgi:hypothetical protein